MNIIDLVIGFIVKFLDGLKVSNPVAYTVIGAVIIGLSFALNSAMIGDGNEVLKWVSTGLTSLAVLINTRTTTALGKVEEKEKAL